MTKTTAYNLHPADFGLGGSRQSSTQQTIYLRPEANAAVALGRMLLAERRGFPQEGLDRLAAAFAARADLAYLQAAAVAWVEQQPAKLRDDQMASTDEWDLANLLKDAQDAADPIVREPMPTQATTCRHGVPYTDDCADCEE